VEVDLIPVPIRHFVASQSAQTKAITLSDGQGAGAKTLQGGSAATAPKVGAEGN